jgi:hypothetical protein
MTPLQSRFFTVKLEPYSYEQFYEITVQLLTCQHKVKQEIATAVSHTVWNKMKSANIRDCVRIEIVYELAKLESDTSTTII